MPQQTSGRLSRGPEIRADGERVAASNRTVAKRGNHQARLVVQEVDMFTRRQAMEWKVVEVVAEAEDGVIPLGIMNVEQAMSLPSDVDVKISLPGDPPGETDRFLDRYEFRKMHARSASSKE